MRGWKHLNEGEMGATLSIEEDSDADTQDMLIRRVGDLTEKVEECKMELQRLRETSYDGRNMWCFDGVMARF